MLTHTFSRSPAWGRWISLWSFGHTEHTQNQDCEVSFRWVFHFICFMLHNHQHKRDLKGNFHPTEKNMNKQRRNCVSDIATGDFFSWWEQGRKSDKVLNKILPERLVGQPCFTFLRLYQIPTSYKPTRTFKKGHYYLISQCGVVSGVVYRRANQSLEAEKAWKRMVELAHIQ